MLSERVLLTEQNLLHKKNRSSLDDVLLVVTTLERLGRPRSIEENEFPVRLTLEKGGVEDRPSTH